MNTDRFAHFFWRFFALLLFLYVAAHLAVRSPWFRLSVERRLSHAFGLPVRVLSVRATESLNLKIRGLHALAGSSALDAYALRVRWSFFPKNGHFIRLLRFEDLTIVAAPDPSTGQFVPDVLDGPPLRAIARFLPDAIPPDALSTDPSLPVPDLPPISVLRGEFLVRDSLGRPRLHALGVDFTALIRPPVPSFSLRAETFTVDGYALSGLALDAVCENGRWSFPSVTRAAP